MDDVKALARRRRIMLSVLAVSAVTLVVGEVLVLLHARSGIGETYGFWLEPLVSSLIFLAVGIVLALRRPTHVVTALIAFGQLAAGAQTFFGAYAHWAASGPSAPLPGAAWSGLLATWMQILSVVSWILILYFVPNGRLPSPRWRWPLAALAVAVPINLVLDGTHATPLDIGGLPSPLAMSALAGVRSVVGPIVGLMVVIGLIGGLAAPFVRYRRASGVERAQLRMIAFGGTAGVGIVVAASPEAFGEWAGSVAWGIGPAMLPVAAGLAIIRYRLFDIDRVVSRTVAYAIVVATLGAAYAGAVLALGQLLPSGSGDLAVAASTLLVAGAFRPVRDRVRSRIDRRFNRAAFDSREALDRFTARVRDEVHLDRLVDALAGTVTSTLEPTRLSVWLPGRTSSVTAGSGASGLRPEG